jgi:SH3-like domain-containing protein
MYSCVARPAVGPMTSALAALALAAIAGSAGAANDPNEGSRLPVPRFVSLKSDHVNVRGGPNKDHDVAWVYHSLLSGRRTAFVAKLKAASAPAALHESADPNSPLKAMLEPGVLGAVKRCSGRWCRFLGNGFDGWIEQERLWGVYPNEKVE